MSVYLTTIGGTVSMTLMSFFSTSDFLIWDHFPEEKKSVIKPKYICSFIQYPVSKYLISLSHC